MSAPALAIPRAALLPALERAAGFQAAKFATNNHLLGLVWLVADGQGVSLSATDATMDVSCSVSAPQQGIAPFACGVTGRKILDLVKRLPDGPIRLSPEADGEKVRVRAGRSNSVLPTVPFAERPAMEPCPEVVHGLAGKRLAAAVSAVAGSIGDDEPLDQIRFTPAPAADGGLSVEASCGHEFVRVRVARPGDDGAQWPDVFDASFGVDARRMAAAAKWLEPATAMAVTAKRLFFADGLGWWSLPVRRGQWPDTDFFLSKVGGPDATVLDLPAAGLAEACARLAVVLPEKGKAVLLDASAAHGVFLDVDGGRGTEDVEGAKLVSGLPLEIVVPARDLAAFVSRAPAEWVRLTLTDAHSPIGVKALYEQTTPDGPVMEERSDWIGILMPLAAPPVDQFVRWEDAA